MLMRSLVELERALIAELICLTNSDKIVWHEMPGTFGNGYKTDDKTGRSFVVEVFRDERPYLQAKGIIVVRNYSIMSLVEEIDRQQKRLRLGEYSKKMIHAKKKRDLFLEQQSKEEAVRRRETIKDVLKDLKDF